MGMNAMEVLEVYRRRPIYKLIEKGYYRPWEGMRVSHIEVKYLYFRLEEGAW